MLKTILLLEIMENRFQAMCKKQCTTPENVIRLAN